MNLIRYSCGPYFYFQSRTQRDDTPVGDEFDQMSPETLRRTGVMSALQFKHHVAISWLIRRARLLQSFLDEFGAQCKEHLLVLQSSHDIIKRKNPESNPEHSRIRIDRHLRMARY